MKILISVDIEGVAGVFHPEQVRAGNGEYERARVWMSDEANAAVSGALAGGASKVWVNDSHGGFRNLLPDRIDPRAQLVLGKPRYLGMMAGLEYGCRGVLMIGYHGRSQSRGILAHTINSRAFARVWLDEQEVGEAGLYGALAEAQGARVLFASGDDVLGEEVQTRFPGIRHVQIKQAAGFGTGSTLAPRESCAQIAAAAREAVAQAVAAGTPSGAAAEAPVRCRVQTTGPAYADLFGQLPFVERLDGVTLAFDAPHIAYAVRILNSMSAMSFMLA